ncbi:MAG TPA: hypothetical protein VLQ80_04870, partial [Candidatus Saccharimonadia bacterium]|nr:hypothetical protein [Candidatus Saccharimonadia bacterium]
GQLRQGVARLIDSYADGLLDKHEFEPRIVRLRQRIAHLEAQRQQLADDAALHTELQLIIGRLEDFAAKVHDRLGEADWTSQRDLIRTLVRRVEVARDQVNIVFRVDPHPEESDPEKKSVQLCRGSAATIGANLGISTMATRTSMATPLEWFRSHTIPSSGDTHAGLPPSY